MSRRSLALLLVGLLAAGCGGRVGGADAPPAGGTIADEGGNVTVEVTWDGRLRPLVFRVAMDTHSVDLDGYDLTEAALLHVGESDFRPAAWEAAKGGHHRSGTLTFEPPAGLLEDAATNGGHLELSVRGVGGKAERVFRWHLSPRSSRDPL